MWFCKTSRGGCVQDGMNGIIVGDGMSTSFVVHGRNLEIILGFVGAVANEVFE